VWLVADPVEGERWLRKAAEAGDNVAMRALGTRLLDGKGMTADSVEGERWLRKAAETGDLEAQTELGERLILGSKLAIDTNSGLDWLRKATDKHYGRAMIMLGTFFLRGTRGIPRYLPRFLATAIPAACRSRLVSCSICAIPNRTAASIFPTCSR
jgi:TPR repeat protein